MTEYSFIFDLDETLIKSEKMVIDAQLHAFQCQGAGELSYEWLYANTRGMEPAKLIELVSGAFQIKFLVEGLNESFQTHFFTAAQKFLKPMPYAAEVLETMHQIKTNMCIASNGRYEDSVQKLQYAGLSEFFSEDRIFGPEHVGNRGKPEPDLLIHAASQMRVEPHQCIMVGDTSYDMEAARSAGTIAIGYAGFDPVRAQNLIHAGANIVFDDWRRFPKIVISLSKEVAPALLQERLAAHHPLPLPG